MEDKYIPLSSLSIGEKARVIKLTSDGLMRRRLLDLGLIKNTVVEALTKALWCL